MPSPEEVFLSNKLKKSFEGLITLPSYTYKTLSSHSVTEDAAGTMSINDPRTKPDNRTSRWLLDQASKYSPRLVEDKDHLREICKLAVKGLELTPAYRIAFIMLLAETGETTSRDQLAEVRRVTEELEEAMRIVSVTPNVDPWDFIKGAKRWIEYTEPFVKAEMEEETNDEVKSNKRKSAELEEES
ncbi:MAG: hypothetical protein M1831_001709 [Alyxoria varia]|nr:MAG: hypothetical protein M1831_001709 [Alyxoria varia]